jgi:glyceraldehyde 3-phosphate dehydrogenase
LGKYWRSNPFTQVVERRHVNIFGWYDNEWGFSNRLIDTTKLVAASL